MRRAPALLLSGVAFCASPGALAADADGPADAPPASIELRKSFRPARRAVRRPAPPTAPGRGASAEAPGEPEAPAAPAQIAAVGEALGERIQSSGTLHLPEVGEGGVVVRADATPILETAAGRRLIIDRDRTIDPGVADEIAGRWPGFAVVQPPPGAGLREVIGSALDAAGYDSVLRTAPLVFGSDVTIRIEPDFIVLRSDRDLLAGETRAISIVDPAAALPAELRALAAQQRVRIVELTPEGAPAGVALPAWRDASGRVTTMASARLTPVLAEIAEALGVPVAHRVPLPAAAGEPACSANLRLGSDAAAVYVLEGPDPRCAELLLERGETAILLDSTGDPADAVGVLLDRLGIAAIGPVVEFYREAAPGSPRRFIIRVPGWLAESGGRRLLISAAAPPPLVRLYLTREGIDIFEYRATAR